MEQKNFFELFPYPSRAFIGRKGLQKYSRWLLAALGKKDLSFFRGLLALEAGCGTGELACALALCGADVIAFDQSSASIGKAKRLAKRLRLKNVKFFVEDLFGFSTSKRFDLVLSLGVLHHTPNPKKGFKKISLFVKPDGLVCIGLYNSFGRLRHRFRRFLLKLFAGNNPEKRMKLALKLFFGGKMPVQGSIWLADKFGQPFESYHSVEEVLQWFKESGFVFAGSRPKIDLHKNLFLQQLDWLFKKKGAFFVMAGRKSSS